MVRFYFCSHAAEALTRRIVLADNILLIKRLSAATKDLRRLCGRFSPAASTNDCGALILAPIQLNSVTHVLSVPLSLKQMMYCDDTAELQSK